MRMDQTVINADSQRYVDFTKTAFNYYRRTANSNRKAATKKKQPRTPASANRKRPSPAVARTPTTVDNNNVTAAEDAADGTPTQTSGTGSRRQRIE